MDAPNEPLRLRECECGVCGREAKSPMLPRLWKDSLRGRFWPEVVLPPPTEASVVVSGVADVGVRGRRIA